MESLLLRLLLLLADADAGHLVLVAGNAPLAVKVGAGHLLMIYLGGRGRFIFNFWEQITGDVER